MSKKQAEGVRIELGGRGVLEVSGLRLKSGETIVFPRIPNFRKHLGVYFPSETRISHHVTHQYANGRNRHTRRKEADLRKVYREFLAAIAPERDPPPRVPFQGIATHRQWTAWLARVLPKMIRSPTDRSIWGLRGAMKDFSDRVISGSEETGLQVLPLDGLLTLVRSSHLHVEDLFERMNETDLSMAGTRVGFTDDFTRAVMLCDDTHLIEVRVEDAEKVANIYQDAFGVNDFVDVLMISEVGQQILTRIREEHGEKAV